MGGVRACGGARHPHHFNNCMMAPTESGCVVIPKSLSHARIAENLRSSGFRLTETQMDEIACLDEGRRVNADIEAIV